VVRNRRSPQTVGDEGEGGTSTDQATFSLGPILVGGWASAAVPALLGPRYPGHEGVAAARAIGIIHGTIRSSVECTG
jgi:hypothetical protein